MLQTVNISKISWQILVDVLKSKGFCIINEEKWYVFMQKKPKNIKVPKLNALPETLVNHVLYEADITQDELLKIRGDLELAN